MIEFTRIISRPEVESGYLNLTDEYGKKHGEEFSITHRTPIAIVDGKNRVIVAKKHHRNQIWGSLGNWFKLTGASAGTRVLVRYDPDERHEDRPVIHLIPVPPESVVGAVPGPESIEEAGAPSAPEIPVSLERQIEDFLAANLHLLEPGLKLYRDDDGREGKQYPTDVGIIDLLCVRSNGDFLVVELKRGKSSDAAFGQVSRYMGFVKQHLSSGKAVSGLILAHDHDENLKYALSVNPSIVVRYFKLKLEIVSENEL
jgi:hypothetical protein